MALAWHVAVFSRQKRLKKLRSYLGRRRPTDAPPEPPTAAERAQIVTAARAWAEQLNRKG